MADDKHTSNCIHDGYFHDKCEYPNDVSGDLSPTQQTMADIAKEVVTARKAFPDTRGLMTALTEEVGEVAKAMLDEPWDNVYNEAKQVAAMAIRLMEECDPTLHVVRYNRGQDVCCEDMARMFSELENKL